MMELKKSDSNELQRTMSIIICLILILIPVFYMLNMLDIFYFPMINVAGEEAVVVVGGLLLLLFLIMFFSKKENRYFTVLDLLVVLYAVSLLLSTIFAEDVEKAVTGSQFTKEGFIVNIVYLLILMSCSVIDNPKYRKWIYVIILVFGVFEVIMAFLQSVVRLEITWGDMEVEEGQAARAFGTLMNQNPFGALMAMLAGLEFGFMYVSKSKKKLLVHGILAFGFVFALILSGTRGAMVGLAGAALIFSILLIIDQKRKEERVNTVIRKLGVVLAVVVVAVVISLAVSGSVVSETIDRVQSDISTEDSSALGSGRIGIWEGAIRSLFLRAPIFGVGVSNFFLSRYNGVDFSVAEVAHNEYLDILCSQGIVGLATYLLLMEYIFISAMRSIKEKGVEESKDKLGLIIATTVYLITAIFGWRIIYLTPYFYVIVGLLSDRYKSKIVFPKR